MQSSSTIIKWKGGNLGRISESEKVIFQLVTARQYVIWWLKRKWIPKSMDSNWKSTSPSMNFNPGNRQVKTRWRGALWTWVLKKAWKIDMKVLPKKEFDRQWCRVWKWCEIEQGASEEISEVGQNEINRGDRVTTLAKQFWTHSSFRISLDAML